MSKPIPKMKSLINHLWKKRKQKTPGTNVPDIPTIPPMPVKKTKDTEDYRKTHLCPRCKYRSDISGGDGYGYNVHCNYAIHAKQTALEYRKDGPPVDRRGEDREWCELFSEGEPDKIKPQKQLFKPRPEDGLYAYDKAGLSRWENGGR